jgi:hypothetical protein
MAFGDPTYNEGALRKALAKQSKATFVKENVNEDFAEKLRQAVLVAPYVKPEVLLDMVKRGASDSALGTLNTISFEKLQREEPEDKKYNWFQRNVSQKIKNGVRFAQAAGDLGTSFTNSIPYLLSGEGDQTGEIFKTSKLGMFLDETKKYGWNEAGGGDGWTLTPRFEERQGVETRSVLSKTPGGITEQGNAFSFGRGFANTINLNPNEGLGIFVSGAIDAFVNIKTDPLGVVFEAPKLASRLVKGKKLSGLMEEVGLEAPTKVTDIYQLGKQGNQLPDTASDWAKIQDVRSEFAGKRMSVYDQVELDVLKGNLTESEAAFKTKQLIEVQNKLLLKAEQEVWNTSLTKKVLQTDKRAQFVVKRIADMEPGSGLAHRIRTEIFRGNISLEYAQEFADAVGDTGKVQDVFLKVLNKLEVGDALVSTNLNKYGGLPARGRAVFGGFKSTTGLEKITDSNKITRFFGSKPQQTLLPLGSTRQRMDTVDNFARFVDVAVGGSEAVTKKQKLDFVDRVMKAVTQKEFDIQQGFDEFGQPIYKKVKGGTRSAVYAIESIVDEVFEMGMRNVGLPEAQIRKVLDEKNSVITTLRAYGSDAAGLPSDYGQLQSLAAAGVVNLDAMVAAAARKGINVTREELMNVGPGVLGELYNQAVFLPDMEILAGLTRGKVWREGVGLVGRSKLTGKERLAVKALDVAINDVWKPSILLTGAYLARNILDGQVRIALTGRAGLSGMLDNPAEWLLWASNRKGVSDIFGRPLTIEELDRFVEEGLSELDNAQQDLVDLANARNWLHGGTGSRPISNMNRSLQLNDAAIVRKADGVPYVVGVIDQLRKVGISAADRALARFQHIDDETERFRKTLDFLYSEEGAAAQQELISMAQSGIKVGTSSLPGFGNAAIKLDTPQQVRTWLQNVIQYQMQNRLEKYSKIPELQTIMLSNRIPVVDAATGRASIFEAPLTSQIINRLFIDGKKVTSRKADDFVGAVFKNDDGTSFLVHNTRVDASGKVTGELIELTDEIVWNTKGVPDNYSDNAVSIISKLVKDQNIENVFPELVPSIKRVDPTSVKEKTREIAKGWQDFLDIFFVGVVDEGRPLATKASKIFSVGRWTTKLEKLPAFRQILWQTYMDNMKGLSRDEALKFREYVVELSSEWKMKPNSVMGGTMSDNRWKALNDLLAPENPVRWGTNTAEDLNTYAYSYAKGELKDLFFDASTKTNFGDNQAMRLLFQFASAWYEAASTYGELIIKNPSEVYKIHRGFTGAINGKLPGSEQGFFYQNEQTGQYVFNAPLSGWMMQKMHNINAVIQMPIKGLSVGLNMVPALGPIGTFAASAILPHVPGRTFFEQMLTPYGPVKGTEIVKQVIPGFLRKTMNLIDADPKKLNEVFGQNYVETYLTLSASGRYDFTDPDDMRKLEKDAINPARTITLLQILSQFFGPSTGTPQFRVEASDGEFYYLSTIANELQKLRDEDYETAIPRFLEIYGENLRLFAAGKTRSTVDGLSHTEQFLQFQLENEDFFFRHKDVAAYFAPEGDEYSWQAFSYQLKKGNQKRIPVTEIKKLSDYSNAAAKYRAERKKFGPFLSTKNEAYLYNFRKGLEENYPGYVSTPSFNPSDIPNLIKDLKNAMVQPEVSDSQTTFALKDYFALRDTIYSQMEAAGVKSLKSKRMVRGRQELIKKGYNLSLAYPDFARLWERALSAEVELVNEFDESGNIIYQD